MQLQAKLDDFTEMLVVYELQPIALEKQNLV